MPGETYAKAGVDIKKVKAIQGSLGELLGGTFQFRTGRQGAPVRPIGLYAGLIDIGGGNALALHTDGVGTKVMLANSLKRYDTVGIDCIAMTVNDLVCVGAEPVAVLDYIALQKEDSALVQVLAKGLVEGAKRASVSIVGGETAILGEMIGGFDLVSMGAGLVRKDQIIDGSKVEEGDTILGVSSSGLHSNGYTLARRIFADRLHERVDSLRGTIGEALLEPTAIYVKPALEAIRKADIHGLAHVTGGAFTKLTRLVGEKKLQFDIVLPPMPPLFSLLMEAGEVGEKEMYRTYNMGVGLCICVPPGAANAAAKPFRAAGFETFNLGTVVKGTGVRVNGLKVA